MKGIRAEAVPLQQPVRRSIPDRPLPWKDNAYLAFWDVRLALIGSAHVSTSPNTEPRRARFSLKVGNGIVEIVEPLEPGSFRSQSLDFELSGSVRVRSLEVTADLSMVPRFGVADYTARNVVPALANAEPLQHYQQGSVVTGRARLAGREYDVQALGFRDRTWGTETNTSSSSSSRRFSPPSPTSISPS